MILFSGAFNAQQVRKLTFDGKLSEIKLDIKNLNPSLPYNWSGYTHLVMEMRSSSPQQFRVWLYRIDGTQIWVMIQPFGQNV
jgi:hypothetical protein